VNRPLVADRNRLANRRRYGRDRACRLSSLAHRRHAGYDVQVLDDAGKPVDGGNLGNSSSSCPLPSRGRSDAVETCPLPRELPSRNSPRLLQDRRRRLHRSGRPHLDMVAPTTSSRRRRPPPLDRRHGGGAGEPPCGRRCAVIGVSDAMKGAAPVGFVLLKAAPKSEAAGGGTEVVGMVRDLIGRSRRLIRDGRRAVPKTRSAGKILPVAPCADRRRLDLQDARYHRLPCGADDITQALKARGLWPRRPHRVGARGRAQRNTTTSRTCARVSRVGPGVDDEIRAAAACRIGNLASVELWASSLRSCRRGPHGARAALPAWR